MPASRRLPPFTATSSLPPSLPPSPWPALHRQSVPDVFLRARCPLAQGSKLWSCPLGCTRVSAPPYCRRGSGACRAQSKVALKRRTVVVHLNRLSLQMLAQQARTVGAESAIAIRDAACQAKGFELLELHLPELHGDLCREVVSGARSVCSSPPR